MKSMDDIGVGASLDSASPTDIVEVVARVAHGSGILAARFWVLTTDFDPVEAVKDHLSGPPATFGWSHDEQATSLGQLYELDGAELVVSPESVPAPVNYRQTHQQTPVEMHSWVVTPPELAAS